MSTVGLAEGRLHPVHARLRSKRVVRRRGDCRGGGGEGGDVPEACPGQEGQTPRSQGHFNRGRRAAKTD